jgi:hypothetical protein
MAKDEMKEVIFNQYVPYNNPYAYDIQDEELETAQRSVACWRVVAVLLFVLGLIGGALGGRYIYGPGVASPSSSSQTKVNSNQANSNNDQALADDEDDNQNFADNVTALECPTDNITSYYFFYTSYCGGSITSSSSSIGISTPLATFTTTSGGNITYSSTDFAATSATYSSTVAETGTTTLTTLTATST